MSISTSDSGSSGKPGGRSSQDFDLNLAPIIDCFTVIITFLLASASFLSIGILDATMGIADPSAQSNAHAPAELVIEVELQSEDRISLQVSGKMLKKATFPPQSRDIGSSDLPDAGRWDFQSLNQELTKIHQRWPRVDSIILSAENDISYNNIIQAMEQIRPVIPNIILGGF